MCARSSAGILITLAATGLAIGLVLVYTAMLLPVTVWVLTPYFDAIPRSLDEAVAVAVDGGSPFTAFFRVAVPLARPGLRSTLPSIHRLSAWPALRRAPRCRFLYRSGNGWRCSGSPCWCSV